MTVLWSERTDVAIIGAGIVGLATALRLLEQKPDLRIVVLEKGLDLPSEVGVAPAGLLEITLPSRPRRTIDRRQEDLLHARVGV